MLTFLSALLLSGIAAYYSIIGLAAIFTGAFWPIVFMGSVLEMSKLVTASWLYRNWKTAPFLLKSYLTCAVIILMFITSMGIFGFLSKSHIDSTLDAGANSVEIKNLNQQEKVAKERLEYLLARAKDPSTASNRLDKQIQETQKELKDVNNRKLPLLREENKLTAEVGPIKYVGELVYGHDDDNAIDKAVRLVIMIIMVVFDPLAVLLLIAANMSLTGNKKEGAPIVNDGEIVGLVPEEDSGVKKFFEKAKEVAKSIDAGTFSKKEEDKVHIDKQNLASMEEEQGESQVVVEHHEHVPGVYTEHHIKNNSTTNRRKKKIRRPPQLKSIEPNYDYDAEYAFKENKKED
jgi:hypothetical protein